MKRIYRKNNRTYYTSKKDAEERRRKGDRIYLDTKEKAFYIKRPIKTGFWW